MKASIIYAYRFLTHNKKKSFAVWISLVLAATMISICFFTVDSIDFTILNDAKSESCGYNLYLFGKTSTVQDLLLNHKNKIEKISQTEITGSISPNLHLTTDNSIIQEQIHKNAVMIEGDLPEKGEILINKLDLTYLGNPEIGDPVEVKITFSDESSTFHTFKVSGIYNGENCPFIDDLPLAFIGEESLDISSDLQLFSLTYIQTDTGNNGASLYSEIERFIFEHENELSGIKLGQYTTYNSILSGTSGSSVYFIFLVAIIAASVMVICTQTVTIKEEVQAFSVIKDLGATDKNFIQISIIKNLFICVLCVPIALCLSALTVFSLTKIAETPYDFYISAKSVVISVLLPFVLTTATTLVSAIIIKKDNRQIDRLIRTSVQLEENKSFWLRYFRKNLTINLKDNVLMTITVSLSVCCLSVFFYTASICSMNIETRNSQLSENNSFITVYANGRSAGISGSQLDKVRSTPFIRNAFAETSYYSEFIMNIDQTEFLMQELDNKDISHLFANSRITNYLRADLIYTEQLENTVDSYGGTVVEGNLDKIFSSENVGVVAVVDNFWTENGKNCYHVGDEIIIRNCEFNSSESSYTPVDEKRIALTVGAVIRSSSGDVYNGYISFPLYVGYETYKQITGYDRYKKLYIHCEPEKSVDVERNLYHIFNTSEYGDEQLIIANQFDGYNEDRIFTQRIYGFINSISVVLMILVFIGVASLGRSRIISRNKELRIMLNIGVPKSEFLKIAVWETFLYTVSESALVSIINTFMLRSVFNMFRATNVFSAETLWKYPVPIFVFTVAFCLVINIVSVTVSSISEIKDTEVNSYAENQ